MRFLSSRDQLLEAVSTWVNVWLFDRDYIHICPLILGAIQMLTNSEGSCRKRYVILQVRFDRSIRVAQERFHRRSLQVSWNTKNDQDDICHRFITEPT